MPVLTGIDLVGIQAFIFQTNRLRDIVNRSYAVEMATRKLVHEAAAENEGEILLSSGGNALLSFKAREQAVSFSARYSRALLEITPDLKYVIAHTEYPGSETPVLSDEIRRNRSELERKKGSMAPSVPFLGLSVNAKCQETGKPASWAAEDFGVNRMLSKATQSIRDLEHKSEERWNRLLPDQTCGWPVAFPREIDRLGRTHGNKSKIALVHVDGNGVGAKILNWLNDCAENGTPNIDVAKMIAEWSAEIDKLMTSVLENMIETVCRSIRPGENGEPVLGAPNAPCSFVLHQDPDTKRVFLPIRPIILGGDDLTFVCDGRIGVSLARVALERFEKASIPHLENQWTASAGIAVSGSHSPFHRLYKRAASLCSAAKEKARDLRDPQSCLTWEISEMPGIGLSHAGKREKTGRPYPLRSEGSRIGLDSFLEEGLDGEQSLRQGSWAQSRNKAKSLREIAARDEAEFKEFMKTLNSRRSNSLPVPFSNWDKGTFHIMDSLELFDLHLRLDSPQESE